MNVRTAELYLPCYRAGKRVEARAVKAAVRLAERDSALQRQLSDQMDFDDQLVEVIHVIKPSEGLRQKLSELSEKGDGASAPLRSQLAHPAIISAFVGVLLIVGFLVYLEMNKMDDFPGRDAAELMVGMTRKMTGVEFEQVELPAGEMGDWFYMHGFENFVLDPDLASLPAAGSRIFRQNGRPVAQLAVDRQNAILYTFRASDFGIDLPAEKGWSIFQQKDWVAAIRSRNGLCTMLAFRGERKEMREFLKTLGK